MTATMAFDYVVRIAGVIALALGLALWFGRLYDLVNLHMALGVAVVLGLWSLAALAVRRGVARKRAILALFWGFVTLALGASQTGLLVGDLHWLVQVAHLILGIGAIALASILAGALKRTSALQREVR